MSKYNSSNRPIIKMNDQLADEPRDRRTPKRPDPPRQRPVKDKNRKKKKSRAWIYVLIAVVVILLAVFVFSGIKAKAEINELKAQARELKTEISASLDALKGMDADAAERAVSEMDKIGDEMLETLDRPWWKVISIIPSYGSDVRTAHKMLTTLDTAADKVFKPFVDHIRNNPLGSIKDENGMNVGLILSYLDFEDTIDPELKAMAEAMSDIEFKHLDMNLSEYSEKFSALSEALDILGEYKDLIRTLLGNGDDRLYLMIAQNSSEIRASGGFPGSMGIVRIEDGYLTVGSFSSVLNYLYSPILPESGITEREVELFRHMYASWAHDACYNPHFAKMAHITKVAYDYNNGEYLDGIISLTPDIIQKILQITGEEFTLSDGTELNGDNATSVIQRDLYFKYQGDASTANTNNDYVDELFAETASRAMASMFSSISMETFPGYIDLFKSGCENNTMMIWFTDESEEQVSIDAGSSGNLNSDPENPVAGVYFSCPDPGKLGMFFQLDTELSEPVTTADGRQEYEVTVTLNNYMDEIDTTGINSNYILGNYGGSIQGYVYFFAPAGGTVSDFYADNGMEISMSEYENLELGYNLDFMLSPGQPVTITYKVTTAEGVETPLRIVHTPTLQDYR